MIDGAYSFLAWDDLSNNIGLDVLIVTHLLLICHPQTKNNILNSKKKSQYSLTTKMTYYFLLQINFLHINSNDINLY